MIRNDFVPIADADVMIQTTSYSCSYVTYYIPIVCKFVVKEYIIYLNNILPSVRRSVVLYRVSCGKSGAGIFKQKQKADQIARSVGNT